MTFQLPDARIEDFGHEFLVRCPACEARALVKPWETEKGSQVRFVCTACGRVDVWPTENSNVLLYTSDRRQFEAGWVCMGAPYDWYFHIPVWLKAPCCGETLCAYNLAHLLFIEDFVRATQRHNPPGEHGWSNRSLRSRLPGWMKAADNRERILKCVERLKRLAADP